MLSVSQKEDVSMGTQALAGHESEEGEFETLIEDISIDGMCGIY